MAQTCGGCGSAVGADDAFCGQCGRSANGAETHLAAPPPGAGDETVTHARPVWPTVPSVGEASARSAPTSGPGAAQASARPAAPAGLGAAQARARPAPDGASPAETAAPTTAALVAHAENLRYENAGMAYVTMGGRANFDPLYNKRFQLQLLRQVAVFVGLYALAQVVMSVFFLLLGIAGLGVTRAFSTWVIFDTLLSLVLWVLFWLIPVPALLTQWSLLVQHRAGAAGSAFAYIDAAFRRHETPLDLLQTRTLSPPGRGPPRVPRTASGPLRRLHLLLPARQRPVRRLDLLAQAVAIALVPDDHRQEDPGVHRARQRSLPDAALRVGAGNGGGDARCRSGRHRLRHCRAGSTGPQAHHPAGGRVRFHYRLRYQHAFLYQLRDSHGGRRKEVLYQVRCRPAGGPAHRRDADRDHHAPATHRPRAAGDDRPGTTGDHRSGAVRGTAGFRPTGAAAQLRLPAWLVAAGAAARAQLRSPGHIVAAGAGTQLRLPRAGSVATVPARGRPARGPAGTPLPATVKPHGGVDRLRGRRGPCARRRRVRRVEVPRPPPHPASVGGGLLHGCREPDRLLLVRLTGGELAQPAPDHAELIAHGSRGQRGIPRRGVRHGGPASPARPRSSRSCRPTSPPSTTTTTGSTRRWSRPRSGRPPGSSRADSGRRPTPMPPSPPSPRTDPARRRP